MIWKDRKYINPRKRVFKNMDTNEILNLEIQDDLDNIEEESETPLNAHNLNMAQQDLLDDMSKTYTGTNITAPTVEGYGRINKVWGHTIEEGTGEKRPTNPYTLKCVGDDVNLLNLSDSSNVASGVTATRVNGKLKLSGTATAAGIISLGTHNLSKGTYYLSTNASSGSSSVSQIQIILNNNMIKAGDGTFTLSESATITLRVFFNDKFSGTFEYEPKICKGSTATPYSPYNKGTVEIISQNGEQQSSNIVMAKPLCCLRDGDNIVAQDWIDYSRGVVHRECGYIKLYDVEPSYTTIRGDYFIAQFNISNYKLKSVVLCNFLQYIDGGNWDIEKESVSYGGSTGNSIQIKVFKSRLATVDSVGLLSFLNFVNATVVYELATPTEEPLNCSNKIVQYSTQTTVLNRDGAEIEASLTNNEAIAEVNGEFKNNEIQTITNENGTAIKFPNGMSICSFFGERATGSTYGDVIWNYPMPFKEAPVVLGLAGQGENYAVLQMMLNSPGTNMAVVQFLQNNSYYVSKKAKFSIVAIGRWK